MESVFSYFNLFENIALNKVLKSRVLRPHESLAYTEEYSIWTYSCTTSLWINLLKNMDDLQYIF